MSHKTLRMTNGAECKNGMKPMIPTNYVICIVQAPFAPADQELVVSESLTPSAPVAPLNVTNDDVRKAELQALVHVGCCKLCRPVYQFIN